MCRNYRPCRPRTCPRPASAYGGPAPGSGAPAVRGVRGTSRSAGYSRWTDRSLHLCFKTVRATFAAHGSSVMCPLHEVSGWLSSTAHQTRDLTFHASPLAGHRSLTHSVGLAHLERYSFWIICPSPSSRQPILGVTPGLGFLRNPSPYAIRLAPAPVIQHVSERTYGVTPFPVSMARIRRAVLSTGFVGSADRSVSKAAGALSCALLAPARQPLALVRVHDGSMHLRLRCP